jgi:hypothetical protein
VEHGPSTQIGTYAGAVRARRWQGNDAAEVLVRTFIKNTRNYVESIKDRYKFYHRPAGCAAEQIAQPITKLAL